MFHDTNPTKGGALAAPINIESICIARELALEKIAEGAAALRAAYAITREAAEIAKGAHHGWHSPRTDRREDEQRANLFPGDFDAEASIEAYRRDLDAAIWSRLIEETGLCRLMDSKERDELEQNLREEVAEATRQNIKATIERLMGDSELMWRRGVARTFASLDRRFKSHDGFKIGSRIILTSVFDDWGGFSYRSNVRQTLYDIERAFALLDNAPDKAGELEAAISNKRRIGHGARQDETETTYFRVRGFKNGNAHLWFKSDRLTKAVNRVLADYYGHVLADAAPETDRPEDYKTTGTAVAKDLAFYPTPHDAVEELLRDFYCKEGERILEPSAGIGNIVRALLQKPVIVDAVEVHPGRADAILGLASDRLAVQCANFLRMKAEPIYDAAIMNPPFSGTHWMKHVRHAFDFLKPGGELRAILPVSAEINDTPGHRKFRAWAECHSPGWRGLWRDLPAESFAEVGVRINTTVLTLRKRSC